MSVEATSSHLDALATARRTADQEIERAVNSLAVAHKQVVAAAVHAHALNQELSKSPGPMSELSDYLALAREVLAEMAAALIEMHPNSGKQALLLSEIRTPSFDVDIRNGLQSKRLAKWETEALRERVVQALAGETKAGQ